ncbi:MAG: general secretion pathway protein GspB [Pseudomonadota bacterium]|nr:general secretion pathway protein GspB [Pseudomonadota bacterium]
MSELRPIARVAGALTCTVLLFAGSVHAATRDDELLVDPTAPLRLTVAPETSGEGDGLFGFLDAVSSNYALSSVLIRSGDRFAVINGERVREGDSVAGARVTRIEPDHVMLNLNGRDQRVELYGASIKTLVKGDE